MAIQSPPLQGEDGDKARRSAVTTVSGIGNSQIVRRRDVTPAKKAGGGRSYHDWGRTGLRAGHHICSKATPWSVYFVVPDNGHVSDNGPESLHGPFPGHSECNDPCGGLRRLGSELSLKIPHSDLRASTRQRREIFVIV